MVHGFRTRSPINRFGILRGVTRVEIEFELGGEPTAATWLFVRNFSWKEKHHGSSQHYRVIARPLPVA